MISKPKSLKDETNTEQSFLQRMVAPVKNVLSYFKVLIGAEREKIVQTCITPNKITRSKTKKLRNEHDASTENSTRVINLPGNEISFEKNSFKNPIDNSIKKSNTRMIFHTESNRFNTNNLRESNPHHLSSKNLSKDELNFLNTKNVLIKEDLMIGKCYDASTEKKKRIQDVLSTVKYTIENTTNYTQQQITLAKRIVEEKNFKTLEKYDGSLKSLNLNNILCTRFEPGKVIYDPSLIKTNLKNSKISNFASQPQNKQDNISINSNTNTNKSFISYVNTDEVSTSQNKKLFNINNKKRNYDEHISTISLIKEDEKLCDMANRTKCGDCLKMKYELSQMKLKIRDSNLQRMKEEKKRKMNSKLSSNEDETPSTINRNNFSNLMMSGSISLSQSRESINNSFASDQGFTRSSHLELNNLGNHDNTHNNFTFNFKPKQIVIPEDNEDENHTASKSRSLITPQFRSVVSTNEFSKKELECRKVSGTLEVNSNENFDKELSNIIANPDDKANNMVHHFKNPINQGEIKDLSNNKICKSENFKVNLIDIQYIKHPSQADKEPENNKIDEKEDKIIANNEKLAFFDVSENNEGHKQNELTTVNNKQQNEEEALKSVKNDSKPTFDFFNKGLSNLDTKNQEKPKFIFLPNDSKLILNASSNKVDSSSVQIEKNESKFNLKPNSKQNFLINKNEINIKDDSRSESNDEIIKNENNQSKHLDLISSLSKEYNSVKENVNENLKTSVEPTTNKCEEIVVVNNNTNDSHIDKPFIERPKGSIANISSSVLHNQSHSNNLQQSFMATDNNQLNKHTIDENNKINPIPLTQLTNTKVPSLLTEDKSNPFLQNNFISVKNHKESEQNLIFNNSSSTINSNIKANNLISNLTIPNNLSINNIQPVSPSSSTYSDMTFGAKNIFDSTVNHTSGNSLNSNLTTGNHFLSNHFPQNININNTVRNNLTTVCEDEGKMSVEKEYPHNFIPNTNLMNPINIPNTNLNVNFNTHIGNNKFVSNSNSNYNLIGSNTNLNGSHFSNINSNEINKQQKPDIKFPVSNPGFQHINNFNMINNHNNSSNNSNTFNNFSFPFNRNLNQSNTINSGLSQDNPDLNKGNPFMIKKPGNNNTTSNSGGLGLFDEHEPTQRKLGNKR